MTTGVVRRPGYCVEKVVYQSLPGVVVAAHLYLPEPIAGRLPALVFFNGHWPKESKMLPTHQALCVNLARRGFAVLNFDPPGQGERGLSRRDHRRSELLPVGIAQEGLMEYETQCAIQYLLSRPEIDPARLGMTGASGGGFQTWITAALDPRIRVAAPVVGTCDFYEQTMGAADKDWDPKDHCHKVPRLQSWANNHELLAMAAPKPVLIVSSVLDHGFPIAGARRVFAYGRGLYASYGMPELIDMFEDTQTGHDFERPKREAVYGWFERWLMNRGDGKPSPEPATEVEPVDSAEMRCFGDGPNRPAGPGIVRAAHMLAEKTSHALARPDYQRCLGKLPAEPTQQPTANGGRVARLIITSEANLQLPAYVLRPDGDARGVVVAAHDGGKEQLADQTVCREALARGWAFCGVDLRGMGELASTHPHLLFAVHLLLGDHLPWRQGWDLAQAARYANSEFPGHPIAFYGDGDGASLAVAYALAMPATRRLARRGFITRGGFLTFRDFLFRPESEAKSFVLQQCASQRRAPAGSRDSVVLFRLRWPAAVRLGRSLRRIPRPRPRGRSD